MSAVASRGLPRTPGQPSQALDAEPRARKLGGNRGGQRELREPHVRIQRNVPVEKVEKLRELSVRELSRIADGDPMGGARRTRTWIRTGIARPRPRNRGTRWLPPARAPARIPRGPSPGRAAARPSARRRCGGRGRPPRPGSIEPRRSRESGRSRSSRGHRFAHRAIVRAKGLPGRSFTAEPLRPPPPPALHGAARDVVRSSATARRTADRSAGAPASRSRCARNAR